MIFSALQRQLIYFPTAGKEDKLLEAAAALGMRAWRDAQGRLIGWRSSEHRDARGRMLVFHGNAGQALDRGYFIAGFHALGAEWEVILFEYPGYGARPGTPSENSIKKAATRAVTLLLDADPRPLYLAGESLGCGVATHLAAAFPDRIAGMLLVTPFTSLVDVAGHHYGSLPVRALLSERYDSLEALSGYRGPVAFLLAGSDEVVPTDLGRRLYDSYRGPRWLRTVPGAGHNTLPYHPTADWWAEVSAFLVAPT